MCVCCTILYVQYCKYITGNTCTYVHTGNAHITCTHLRQLINPQRACAARVTVVVLCVCPSVRLSVCLFVHDYSRTTGYEAAYELYQHLQCYKGTKIKLAILLKRLRSRDMA